MQTVIFGGGFLGRRFAKDLPDATLLNVDITDRAAVRSALREHRPKAVVNAAGKTGRPNVDWCETHQPETYRANVAGALSLAEACAEADIYLLHMGSGCIFYGDSPTPGGWREDDFANPSSFYSRTKYAADLILSRLPNVAIARLRMPIDNAPDARNLITKLVGYREIVDVENSVTVVDDLIDVTRQLVEKRSTGVFHVVNPGSMRHRDLLKLYQEVVDPSHTYHLISAEELVARGLAAKARSNCVLASPRLEEVGISMRSIDVALRDTMARYARSLRNPETPTYKA